MPAWRMWRAAGDGRRRDPSRSRAGPARTRAGRPPARTRVHERFAAGLVGHLRRVAAGGSPRRRWRTCGVSTPGPPLAPTSTRSPTPRPTRPAPSVPRTWNRLQCRGGQAGLARRKRDPGRRLLPPHPQRRPARRSAGTGGGARHR